MDPPQPPARFMRGSADPVEITRTVLSVLDGSRPGPAAVATVVQRAGSAPQATGAKLVLLADETLVGTVGGGAIEAQVIDACRTTLRDGRSRKVAAHLVRDLGMCCGGSMEVFVEYVQAQARLFVIGGGHVAQAVVPLAAAAGFRVTVLDDREDLLTHPAFEGVRAEAYDVDELDAAIDKASDDDYLLIVTRDHARDEAALAALLRRPHRYIGMIGSRRKVHTVLGRILRRERELGRAAPDLTRVRAPVGLSLGGKTPPEIAVSIVAELVAHRHGGSGAPMSVVDAAAASSEDSAAG
jgi:xanthine dehydrogenase accessory factor